MDQSYDNAYAKIVPVWLNAVQEIGPGTGSKAIEHMRVSEGSARTKERNVLLSRVRASLSQKLMVPSEPVVSGQSSKWTRLRVRDGPQVENVPCTGWNVISFTAYTRDWSLEVAL